MISQSGGCPGCAAIKGCVEAIIEQAKQGAVGRDPAAPEGPPRPVDLATDYLQTIRDGQRKAMTLIHHAQFEDSQSTDGWRCRTLTGWEVLLLVTCKTPAEPKAQA